MGEAAVASIRLTTRVAASRERCFDLARDLDLHVRSMQHTSERAVAGRTTGLIELGEEVTWEGRHFGILHRHTSRITQLERPKHFRDSMVRGRFARFDHDHYFETDGAETLMRDEVAFASPLGPIGWLVDRLYLTRYLTTLLERRNGEIKREAERRPA